jgi:hypothetical protein
MSISMHQASVPVFTRALGNLKHVLELGEAHAAARGFDPALLVQARLTPDMLPLVRQVQIACDMAMRGCARQSPMMKPISPACTRVSTVPVTTPLRIPPSRSMAVKLARSC